MSWRAAAAHLGVSTSSTIRWRRLALQHGQAVAKPRGGDRHSSKVEQDSPDVLRQRRDWFDGQLDLDSERIVVIDKTP
jgi:transposase